MDKMNHVSRCELVYSKKFDILPYNYYVSLTTSRFQGLHFESHAISLCCNICKKAGAFLDRFQGYALLLGWGGGPRACSPG